MPPKWPAPWLAWFMVNQGDVFVSGALTQLLRCNAALLDRPADHRREFTHQTIGDLPGHRELALALEFLDRGLGVGTDLPVGFSWP